MSFEKKNGDTGDPLLKWCTLFIDRPYTFFDRIREGNSSLRRKPPNLVSGNLGFPIPWLIGTVKVLTINWCLIYRSYMCRAGRRRDGCEGTDGVRCQRLTLSNLLYDGLITTKVRGK